MYDCQLQPALFVYKFTGKERDSEYGLDNFVALKGAIVMAWFYEIRNSNNTALKRDGGFATRDAAKIAGREDAKKMKSSRQPDRPDVGTIMVGQNNLKPTR